MIKRLLLLTVLAVLAVTLFGCNTVSGLGRDITGASQSVESWVVKP